MAQGRDRGPVPVCSTEGPAPRALCGRPPATAAPGPRRSLLAPFLPGLAPSPSSTPGVCVQNRHGPASPGSAHPEEGWLRPERWPGIPSPPRRLSEPLLIVSVDSSPAPPHAPVPCKTRKHLQAPLILSAPQCSRMDGLPTGGLGGRGGTLASVMKVPPLPPPPHAQQPLLPSEWPCLLIIQTVCILGSFRFTEK